MSDDSDLFNMGRICDCCGANQDAEDIESLKILYSDFWKYYRLDGKKYRRTCAADASHVIIKDCYGCFIAKPFSCNAFIF
jgi:hypothetical protein